MRGIVYMVLPECSSYQYKGEVEKRRIKELIESWYYTLVEANYKVTAFAEDFLAVELLYNIGAIRWQSILSVNDMAFLESFVTGIPDVWSAISKRCDYKCFIEAAIKKHKNPDIRKVSNSLEFRSLRFKALRKRMRFVANSILDEAQFVVYIDANNNFCNLPIVEVGDGKMVVKVELYSRLVEYTFGGLPLTKVDFENIVRSV